MSLWWMTMELIVLSKIWFNGNKTDENEQIRANKVQVIDENGEKKEYCKPQFEKYICNDFSKFY